MTTITRLQLANLALGELTVVGSGQSPDAEDTAYVNSRYDGFVGELESRGVLTIPDDQEIPIEWSGPLSELLASECARKFGKSKMSDQDRETVEDRLRIIVNRMDVKAKLTVDPALQGRPYGYSLARWTRGI